MFGSMESVREKVSASFMIRKNKQLGSAWKYCVFPDNGFFIKTMLGHIQLVMGD